MTGKGEPWHTKEEEEYLNTSKATINISSMPVRQQSISH